MDPYLEGVEWTSVHIELSSEIARQLAPKLRPKYIVRAMRRFVTEMPEDIAITTSESAVGMPPAPLQLATVMPVRIPHVTIEIHDVANRDLVTAIEVFSPTNKRGEGYQEYLDKRRRLLYSTSHLIEIDLLRKGRRVPMQQPLPPAPYFVFLSRVEKRPIMEVWPIQITMPLPLISVPLLVDDPDVTLDLQLALNTVYDALNYDLSVDYTRPPDVRLAGEAAAWAVAHLQAAGFLSRDS
jgi:hypothetical protein